MQPDDLLAPLVQLLQGLVSRVFFFHAKLELKIAKKFSLYGAGSIVFNRGTEMATVRTGVDASAKAHGNFKRRPHESGFRYVFHAHGDTNRKLIVTVLVFHVPK